MANLAESGSCTAPGSKSSSLDILLDKTVLLRRSTSATASAPTTPPAVAPSNNKVSNRPCGRLSARHALATATSAVARSLAPRHLGAVSRMRSASSDSTSRLRSGSGGTKSSPKLDRRGCSFNTALTRHTVAASHFPPRMYATDAARGLSQPKHVAPAHPASTDFSSIIRPNARSSDLCAAFSRRVPR